MDLLNSKDSILGRIPFEVTQILLKLCQRLKIAEIFIPWASFNIFPFKSHVVDNDNLTVDAI